MTIDKTKVLIRCDCDTGKKIGHGHAMRCYALAERMEMLEVKPIFIMREITSFFQELLIQKGIKLIKLKSLTDEAKEIFEIAAGLDSKNIVLDSYWLGQEYRETIKTRLHLVEIKDDGPVMFRQEIWQNANSHKPKVDIKKVFLRVEASERACLSVISELELEFLIPNGSNALELMLEADIAISASGVMAWELALIGIPSFLYIFGNNQKLNAKRLAEMGVSMNMGNGSKLSKDKLTAAIKSLDYSKRVRMNKIMPNLLMRNIIANGTDYYIEQLCGI